MGELSAAVREANLQMTERAKSVLSLSVTACAVPPLPKGEALMRAIFKSEAVYCFARRMGKVALKNGICHFRRNEVFEKPLPAGEVAAGG